MSSHPGKIVEKLPVGACVVVKRLCGDKHEVVGSVGQMVPVFTWTVEHKGKAVSLPLESFAESSAVRQRFWEMKNVSEH